MFILIGKNDFNSFSLQQPCLQHVLCFVFTFLNIISCEKCT